MAKPLLFLLALFSQLALASGALNLIEQFKQDRPMVEDLAATIDTMTAAEINGLVDEDGQSALFYSRHQGTTLLLLAGANANLVNHAGRAPAFRAVSQSSDPAFPAVLDLLLLAHADVNARDKDSITLLAWAAHENNLPAAKLLLLMGADPSPTDVPGDRTPLFFASQQTDTKMTDLLNTFAYGTAGKSKSAAADANPGRKLVDATRAARLTEVSDALAAGADVNARDKDGSTALFRAVAERRASVVAMLLLNGANPNLVNNEGKTPLIQCAVNYDMASERILMDLILAGADVNVTAKAGITALSMAVHCRNDTAAEWLIRRKASLDVHAPEGTLMQSAALNSNWPSMVTLLKKAGLKEEAPIAKLKDPALFDAVRSGTFEDVETELGKVKTADVSNRFDQTALEWAVCTDRFDVVDLLLRHGANINHQHKDHGEHIIHTLAKWKTNSGTPPAVRMENLVKRGASPDLKMEDGCTPLMVAARGGAAEETVGYLIKVTGDINARDKQGLTALGLARQHGHAELARLLQKVGAVE